jgi:magnesium-transporting ATPase (P-type)
MKKFVELEFEPFNPTDKRAEATIRAADNSVFRVTKGAPQAVLRMCHNAAEIRDKVDQAVQDLADRGFRALGLAIKAGGPVSAAAYRWVAKNRHRLPGGTAACEVETTK